MCVPFASACMWRAPPTLFQEPKYQTRGGMSWCDGRILGRKDPHGRSGSEGDTELVWRSRSAGGGSRRTGGGGRDGKCFVVTAWWTCSASGARVVVLSSRYGELDGQWYPSHGNPRVTGREDEMRTRRGGTSETPSPQREAFFKGPWNLSCQVNQGSVTPQTNRSFLSGNVLTGDLCGSRCRCSASVV